LCLPGLGQFEFENSPFDLDEFQLQISNSPTTSNAHDAPIKQLQYKKHSSIEKKSGQTTRNQCQVQTQLDLRRFIHQATRTT